MKANISVMLISIALLTGCGTTGKFVYPANMSTMFKAGDNINAEKTVAILPFDDFRSAENSDCFTAYMIPLLPYGWAEYERPEAALRFLTVGHYDITPAEDLAKATSLSLRRSGLFRDAFFTMGADKDKADFVWSGRIKVLRYDGKMFSYCLSIVGPLLWDIALPLGVSENTLAVEFKLKDKAGNLVWEYSAERSASVTQGLYYRSGHDCRAFATMYQSIMNDALSNLSNAMISKHLNSGS